ncbi:MAG: DNA replication/repair protein RecF [Alphaproteobacteria bacterium]|nr:DNA replication/repair protein RecF [Alphaproteobacteria bacterium]
MMPEGATAHRAPSGQLENAGVTRLVLTHYRSYDTLHFTCDPSCVVLTGENGAGKTNILEALSLFSPGTGLRQAKLSDLTRRTDAPTSSLWSAFLHVSEDGLTPLSLGTGLDLREGKERRLIQMDGRTPLSQSDLTRILGILWLTPAMDRLFVEAASSRRRFLDRLVYLFDASHASHVAKYDYLIRERLRLLKTRTANTPWLDTLEEKAAQVGVALAAARLFFIERLNRIKHDALGYLPLPHLEVDGFLELHLKTHKALDVEGLFQERLRQNRSVDQESGRTTLGPHKTDLVVFYNEKQMPAAQSSTGEQKALLLSLIMATARLRSQTREGVPLLLLDEVVAHLDPVRREALLEEILYLGMQTWMTGTDRDAFSAVKGRMQHFHLEKGGLTPL